MLTESCRDSVLYFVKKLFENLKVAASVIRASSPSPDMFKSKFSGLTGNTLGSRCYRLVEI